MILPDVLDHGLKVVFCGYAAGTLSAKKRCYYANPENLFWPTLHAIGLTDRVIEPCKFRDVLQYGIGLTDLAKNSYGPNDKIPLEDIDPSGFKRKIDEFRPRVVAFNGYRTAEWVLSPPIRYGRHSKQLHGADCFVLHSTSSRVETSWSDEDWVELANHVRKIQRGSN